MNWHRVGRAARAIRLRLRLRQGDVARRARISRSTVSLLERGHAGRLSVDSVESVLAALGARLEGRLAWAGPELDRMLDAGHAALAASVKRRLDRWGWLVQVEASYNRYGERGRIDLLAWHPPSRILLVVELKTDLVDVQALLGGLDSKARLATHVAAAYGWRPAHVVPMIVFQDDPTTRRRLRAVGTLFDRFAVQGRAALTWLRSPSPPVPSGLLWLTEVSNARVVRISGQRVRYGGVRRDS